MSAGDGSAEATVSWADDYCGAMTELVKSVSTLPTVDSSSVERASETSSELLRVLVGGLDRTLDRLGSLAAPPVEGAERVRSEAVEVYSGIRDRAGTVLENLEAATGSEASRQAVSAVKEPLDDIGARNLLEGFDSVPQLRDASSEAPTCGELLGSDSGARLDPPGS